MNYKQSKRRFIQANWSDFQANLSYIHAYQTVALLNTQQWK